jgi:hypothetical protein
MLYLIQLKNEQLYREVVVMLYDDKIVDILFQDNKVDLNIIEIHSWVTKE